jgi:hypothetical protein
MVMVESQIHNHGRRRAVAVVGAAVSSILFCCVLSVALSFPFIEPYVNTVLPGWHSVELPVLKPIRIPECWSYAVDADSGDATIADKDGNVRFTGFLDEGVYPDLVMEHINQRLDGYEFVRQAQDMTDERNRWQEYIYRDLRTGELAIVQVITTRGTGGLFCLYSTPGTVDRNTARKMAFSF